MPQRLIAGAAWACLAFIVYATLCPLSIRPELIRPESDLVVFIERFGAYALLGCLFSFKYPRRILFVGLIVFGSAVLLEFLQIFVPDRDARISDALVKLAGGFIGISLARAIRTFSGYPSAEKSTRTTR
jgi:VanZ family protein